MAIAACERWSRVQKHLLKSALRENSGGLPKRSNGTDCKSVGSAFAGSNPAAPTLNRPQTIFVAGSLYRETSRDRFPGGMPRDIRDITRSQFENTKLAPFAKSQRVPKIPRLSIGVCAELVTLVRCQGVRTKRQQDTLSGVTDFFRYHRQAGVAQWQSSSLPSWW